MFGDDIAFGDDGYSDIAFVDNSSSKKSQTESEPEQSASESYS